MSIARNRMGFDGEISFECDDCGEELHAERADFHEALAYAKREQWKITKERGDWVHYCPDCSAPANDFEA